MGRPPCCDKSNVKRGLWTEEEDLKLIAYTRVHGASNWSSVPKKAGLKRCGKSCRLRWTNYLRPNLKRESFTPEEEELIIYLHATLGSRWSVIAGYLQDRTDNDVKNYWNTKLSKKLIQRGIDPVTHRPISEIIQTIGTLPTNANRYLHDSRISCLNRDLKSVFMHSKPAIRITTTSITAPNPEAAASSSSSLPADMSWSDFLVADALLPSDSKDATNYCAQSSFGASSSQSLLNEYWYGCPTDQASSSSVFGGASVNGSGSGSGSGSFVDELLDQDREMMSDFLPLLCDADDLPLDYVLVLGES